MWTTEVPAPAPPPPPALSELGVSCLSVRIWRLRRPPAFHGEGGGRRQGGFRPARETGGDEAEGEGPARPGAVAVGRWVARAGEVGAGEGLLGGRSRGWGSAKGCRDLRRCAGRRVNRPRVLSADWRRVLGDCQNKEADGIETDARGGKMGIRGRVERGERVSLEPRAFGVLEAVS